MGSDETAITIPGGPRVIDVFYGDGAPSGPNYLLFSDGQIGSWTPSGVGLVVGSRLHRIRRCLGLSGGSGSKSHCQVIHGLMSRSGERIGRLCPEEAGACGYRRLHVYNTDPRRPQGTSGPRIDRIPPARPPWWARQYRELKKLFFSAPSNPLISLDH